MARNRRTEVLAAEPTAREAVDQLRKRGATRQADAINTIIDYALHAVDRTTRKAERDTTASRGQTLDIDNTLHAHIKATAAEGDTAAVIVDHFNRFLAGEWTPDEWASRKEPYGTKHLRTAYNVRLPLDLWTRVNDLGQDETAAEERGYPLTARQVAKAALVAAYPLPDAD